MNVDLYFINHFICKIIFLSIMLSIVFIFSSSLPSYVTLNSNLISRYRIFFQCSSGPKEGYRKIPKISPSMCKPPNPVTQKTLQI